MNAGYSKFEPIASDSSKQDGLNVHAFLVDELHEHKTPDLYQVLSTATGARRQPVGLAITTAGFSRQSFCYQQHDLSEKILANVVQDDTTFCFIACLDKDDNGEYLNWQDEKNWEKANPNYGNSVSIADLRRKAQRALDVPSELNNFLRKHLNVWTSQENKWMPMNKWALCSGLEQGQSAEDGRRYWAESLRGRRCFGGLDLSSVEDYSCFCLIFPPSEDDAKMRVLPFLFIPNDTLEFRARRDRVPVEMWKRLGFVIAVDGPTIDYAAIEKLIVACSKAFDLQYIGADGWNSKSTIDRLMLEHAIKVELVQQGYGSLTGPTKEMLRLVLNQQLAHLNNPALTWMASNVAVTTDAAGNIKPAKDRCADRIDGIAATIDALAVWMAHAEEGSSVYEGRGIVTI
jgi:phage terminase large subunit-like protein